MALSNIMLSDKITLKMLKYFYTVSKTQHFGKAALQLNVSNSPLSSQIKELESALDVQLFVRDSRNVKLTQAGLVLKSECETIFHNINRALSHVQKVEREQHNTLKIGLVSSAFWTEFGSMLKSFNKQFPNYNVDLLELNPETQKQALQNKEIDIGIVRFADALNIHPFLSLRMNNEEFVVAVSDEHPLTACSEISLKDLKDENFTFMSRKNSASAEMVIDACMQAGFIPVIDKELIEPNTLMAYVANSQTVTVVPSSFAQHQWQHIHFLHLKESLPASLCLMYDKAQKSDICDAFIESILNKTKG